MPTSPKSCPGFLPRISGQLQTALRRAVLRLLGLEIVEEVFGSEEDVKLERLRVRAIVQLKESHEPL